MEPGQSERVADHSISTDLKAAVAARRELPAELEDQVLEAFLARVEQRVDARVAAQVKEARPVSKQMKGDPIQVEVVAGSFALCIPLVAIAGGIAGAAGIIAVVVGLIAVNLLYFIDRWVRMG